MPSSLRLTARNDPNDAQPSSDVVSFQQQGTVDWTTLGRSSITASLDVLARISAGNVDGLTVVVARAIGNHFQWQDVGRERFDKAVHSCASISTYRKALWIGFGIQHIVHVMVSTDQGAICAALCACLAECYSVSFVAGVMLELTKQAGAPDRLSPSLQQWRTLVESCAGLVSKTTYGIHAEHFMKLDGHRKITHNVVEPQSPSRTSGRGVTSKRELADVLLGLASLSRGGIRQMTVVGGADAGLIAALAEWMLSLKFEIKDYSSELLLYTNCKTNERPQLLIFMVTSAENTNTGSELQCIGKVYRLSDATAVLATEIASSQNTVLSGRVPYETALSDAFGQDFENLLKLNETLGTVIGCASNIYRAIYYASDEIPQQWLRDCSIYSSRSFGSEFVHFIRSRFPELQLSRNVMQAAAMSQSTQKTLVDFEAAVAKIRMVCGCRAFCQADEQAKLYVIPEERTRFCLVVLAHTIIKTARSLTCIETELAPMRAGLEEMYRETTRRIIVPMPSHVRPLELLSVENIIEVQGKQRAERELTLFETAHIIFSGRRPMCDLSPGLFVSAFSENGFCYLYGVLKDPFSSDEMMSRVHVVPGRIEYRHRPYKMLQDGGERCPPLMGASKRSIRVPSSVLKQIEACHGADLKVLVTEKIGPGFIGDLEIEYELVKDNHTVATVGPAKMLLTIANNSGLFRCLRDKSCDQAGSIMSKVASKLSEGAATCTLEHGAVSIRGDDTAARFLALTSLWEPIVQKTQCLQCCLRYGVGQGWSEFSIIFSDQKLALRG